MRRAIFIVLAAVFVMCGSSVVRAEEPHIDFSKLPVRAEQYIPMLFEQTDLLWPEMEQRSVLCAQIETETCISLTHRYCWSPTATLKTSREEGRGLGQITRAWDSKGNLRFDSLTELRNKHQAELDGWSWKNVGDAFFQIRGLILMDRDLYMSASFAATQTDRYAFMDAGYNGGWGGVLSDRQICMNTPGCDPNVWKDNVENTSKKARKAADGYGKGFFYINREHVFGVVYGLDEGQTKTRRARYQKAGIQ